MSTGTAAPPSARLLALLSGPGKVLSWSRVWGGATNQHLRLYRAPTAAIRQGPPWYERRQRGSLRTLVVEAGADGRAKRPGKCVKECTH